VAHLFHPEAGGGAVEEAEEGEVVVFARLTRQLDHRGRLLKHLPALVQHEIIVRGDFCEHDGQRRL